MSEKSLNIYDNISVVGVFGEKFNIDIKELNTVDFFRAVGGILIISELNDDIPPISCVNDCEDIAEFLALGIGKDDSLNGHCFLCGECMNELSEAGSYSIPRLVS